VSLRTNAQHVGEESSSAPGHDTIRHQQHDESKKDVNITGAHTGNMTDIDTISGNTPTTTLAYDLPPAIQVAKHPYKGRCFLAVQPIKAGQVILTAQAFTEVPDAVNFKRLCGMCVQPRQAIHGGQVKTYGHPHGTTTTNPTTTSNYSNPVTQNRADSKLGDMELDVSEELEFECLGGCGRAYYCSRECQQQDWEWGHKWECGVLKEFIKEANETFGVNGDKADDDEKAGYAIDYTWLLLRIIARYQSGAIQQQRQQIKSGSLDPEEPLGTPSVTQSFQEVWALCENASAFAKDVMYQDFGRCALALSKLVALIAFEKNVPADTILAAPSDHLYLNQVAANLLQINDDNGENIENNLVENYPLTPTPQTHTTLQHLIQTLGYPTTQNILASTLALICKEECNSFGLYNFHSDYRKERQGYALAIYPSAVFFNHSCAPNLGHTTRPGSRVPITSSTTSSTKTTATTIPATNNHHDTILKPTGNLMVFYALRDIQPGDELCIAYRGLQFNKTVSDALPRRQHLKNDFFFDCDCERCEVEMWEYQNERNEQSQLQGQGDRSNQNQSEDGNRQDKFEKKVEVEERLKTLLCGEGGCKAFFAPGVLSSSKAKNGQPVPQWVCEGCQRVR
jgi:hypothetical protein